jgi:hypothetical protein
VEWQAAAACSRADSLHVSAMRMAAPHCVTHAATMSTRYTVIELLCLLQLILHVLHMRSLGLWLHCLRVVLSPALHLRLPHTIRLCSVYTSIYLQGFPRSDIDIHAVRTDRNAIVRLTNDHKQITSQLEQLLHKIHALARWVMSCFAETSICSSKLLR